ncbi:aquaporin [Rhodophyticola porphyridii]|uniref:Aquaporin family protein n=1 Tax=Rhodophyticola porphyridii TaxID=1852017 RepID=A0A3L9Y2T5_9RHOB|nr:MIP/aquaporin family protein [Rhodophyticola porphyridii]RMA41407.1 aquaporin family protein [Rhodophyticola porphyridii]
MLNKLLAEGIGTAFLLIGVVGSGIMAASLSPDNTGVALMANAIATGCILYVIITLLGPISGAHFNPAVTLAFLLRGEIPAAHALAYILVQIGAGILGVWIAHLMFELPVLQLSGTIRSGPSQWFSEVVATFGLLFVILGGLRHAASAIPTLVALYITGAYWFTSSTSFANPAVTIARALSDTFAGILPGNMPVFIAMQVIGAVAAVLLARRLFAPAPG